MQSSEEWRPVVGEEGRYEVSSLGRVRSVDRVVTTTAGRNREHSRRYPGRILSQHLSNGYPKVHLSRYNAWVHRLVAEAFLERPEGATDVCHNDGNPLNPAASNLRWDTHEANMRDTLRHGTSVTAIPADEVPAVLARLRAGETQKAVAASLGVAQTTISKLVRRAAWQEAA